MYLVVDHITVVGMDPSLRNWGLVKGKLNLHTGLLSDIEMQVVRSVSDKTKSVRVNSKDIYTAYTISHTVNDFLKDADAIFVEVPVGSQNARSMASYGICIGILGAIEASGKSFYQLMPNDIKMAGAGFKTASKKDMINWATGVQPNAPWPMVKRKGELLIVEGEAEHMADALAAIYAGVKIPEFKTAMNLLKK